MAANNNCGIIGNLTRDPQLRTTQKGHEVASFGVAVNDRRNDSAEFFDVSIWGKSAKPCVDFLKKGAKVAVQGRVSLRNWEAKDGTTRSSLTIDGQDVEFLTPKSEAAGQTGTSTTKAQPAAQAATPAGLAAPPTVKSNAPF